MSKKVRYEVVRVDIDRNNYKPYRTKAQKAEARKAAERVNGTWVSKSPVSHHSVRKDLLGLVYVEIEEDPDEE